MAVIQDSHTAESETLCEGDTRVIFAILPDSLAQNIFERVRNEVDWQRMSHQGGEVPRLVAVQGQIEADGSKPVYRHPADESPPLLPFTPVVDEIRHVVEAKLGHPLNHVLIQFYRHGNDYISEHSDKTLDIAKGSFIANVSLGAERTMTLRTKRQLKDQGSGSSKDDEPSSFPDGPKRQVQRARLPHNSLFQMGLATNMRWMHAIRQDKRLAREKSAAELAYDGARISLTFRRIGTFLDSEDKRIWGQGATGKTKEEAHEVINGQTPEAVNMLRAFGRENQSTKFNWDLHYGGGFDVLHLTAAARLFLSADPVINMRVQMMLGELGIGYARGSMTSSDDEAIRFVDNDKSKTALEGQRDIMLYLHQTYGEAAASQPTPNTLSRNKDRAVERFEQGLRLLDQYRAASSPSGITKLLVPWESYTEGVADFIAGPTPGLVDFAFWPVLHAILSSLPDVNGEAEKHKLGAPNLLAYYDRIRAREPIAQMLAASRS
jgi:alkylated DNA repair dioxygenase AlkB